MRLQIRAPNGLAAQSNVPSSLVFEFQPTPSPSAQAHRGKDILPRPARGGRGGSKRGAGARGRTAWLLLLLLRLQGSLVSGPRRGPPTRRADPEGRREAESSAVPQSGHEASEGAGPAEAAGRAGGRARRQGSPGAGRAAAGGGEVGAPPAPPAPPAWRPRLTRLSPRRLRKLMGLPEAPEPRALSLRAMEQIRYLRSAFPEEWPAGRLAQGFGVTPEVIRRVLKSRFRPSPERGLKQDARAGARPNPAPASAAGRRPEGARGSAGKAGKARAPHSLSKEAPREGPEGPALQPRLPGSGRSLPPLRNGCSWSKTWQSWEDSSSGLFLYARLERNGFYLKLCWEAVLYQKYRSLQNNRVAGDLGGLLVQPPA
uniref:Neurite outgrowth-associated protein n=1 Tax=Naja naja TaxID=35670 RepID=A0A8C6Y520_NAJNA